MIDDDLQHAYLKDLPAPRAGAFLTARLPVLTAWRLEDTPGVYYDVTSVVEPLWTLPESVQRSVRAVDPQATDVLCSGWFLITSGQVEIRIGESYTSARAQTGAWAVDPQVVIAALPTHAAFLRVTVPSYHAHLAVQYPVKKGDVPPAPPKPEVTLDERLQSTRELLRGASALLGKERVFWWQDTHGTLHLLDPDAMLRLIELGEVKRTGRTHRLGVFHAEKLKLVKPAARFSQNQA